MACECAECTEFNGPNPRIMGLRFLIIGVQFLVAIVGLVKERSWKALSVFLGALAFFATIPRKLICCRCEGYGTNCYPLYLGKITSMYLPKVEGKEISELGVGLELIALSTISNAPAVGLRGNKKLLAFYLLLSTLTVVLHFSHACRHCALYATDWRKDCPSAKTARLFFGAGRDVAL